jgi:hypothetical protein
MQQAPGQPAAGFGGSRVDHLRDRIAATDGSSSGPASA